MVRAHGVAVTIKPAFILKLLAGVRHAITLDSIS